MKSLVEKDTLQIEITNACVMQCSNCTRMVGHSKPFYMDLDFFKKAVDSLEGFPKMVGVMGGEPLLHPQFEEMARYLQSKFPRIQTGLWTTFPKGKEHYGPLIAEVFGNLLLNDHTLDNLMHAPVLVGAEEVVEDEFVMWQLIDHCWLQNSWSGSITPKGGFFCEVAAAMDIIFDGPGGWPIEPGWWKKTPKDFKDQVERWCVRCGVAVPMHARTDVENIDDISPRNLEELMARHSPKIKKGRYEIYNKGFDTESDQLNEFRKQTPEYFHTIAAKYDMKLRVNRIGYLEPYYDSIPTV